MVQKKEFIGRITEILIFMLNEKLPESNTLGDMFDKTKEILREYANE